jgi:hypothetical protein
LTRIVPWPEVEAVFTNALVEPPLLDAAEGWLEAALLLELWELLPHAAKSSEAASVGNRNLIETCTVTLLCGELGAFQIPQF